MKLNKDKCHLMPFGDKSNISLNIGTVSINRARKKNCLE